MDLPTLLSRPALRAAGFSDTELRKLLRTGELTSVRPGRYVRGRPPDDAARRHLVAARAALDRLADGALCSHVTAAVVHGLPIWRLPLGRVHVTRPGRRSGSRRNGQVHVHAAPVSAADVDEVAGFPVTGVARTVVDLARTVPFEDAVVLVDAALRGGTSGGDDPAVDRGGPVRPRSARPDALALVGAVGAPAGRPDAIRDDDVQPARGRPRPPLDPAELATVLAGATGWPGAPGARRVIAVADGRSESVGESRSRIALRAAGLPDPVLQWRVVARDGTSMRTDFAWPQQRTVGEFDGRVKYGRLLRSGQDPGQIVFDEKRREDRLRELGLSVVRWTWADLDAFDEIAAGIRARLAR